MTIKVIVFVAISQMRKLSLKEANYLQKVISKWVAGLGLKPSSIWFQSWCYLQNTTTLSLILLACCYANIADSIEYTTLGKRGAGVGAWKKKKVLTKCALLRSITSITSLATALHEKHKELDGMLRISQASQFSVALRRWLQDTGHAIWKPYAQNLRKARRCLAEYSSFERFIPPVPYSPLRGCWLGSPSLQGTQAITNFPQTQHFFWLSGSFSWGCSVKQVVL